MLELLRKISENNLRTNLSLLNPKMPVTRVGLGRLGQTKNTSQLSTKKHQ